MIDAHCHLDLYSDPSGVAAAADRAGVTTIFVTNSPAAFERARPHIQQFRGVRIALGLHPLRAAATRNEWKRFQELTYSTSYIGEVGLDFSPAGVPTKQEQLSAFRFVLQSLSGQRKFISIHSRRAEFAVLDLLQQNNHGRVVFHWYSGSLGILDRAISDGHYFSVNLSMSQSKSGQRIIERIPQHRLLTETDGPFVKIGNRSAEPRDVSRIEEYLALVWNISASDVRKTIWQNLRDLIHALGLKNDAAANSSVTPPSTVC